MSQIEFLTVLQTALILILELAGPVLLTTMVVGLVIGVFQSVTQIQEATLTFVPKILAGILTVMFTAPWMLDVYINAVNELFANLVMSIK
ncbi:MAG TPA: flagellar biosynthetic protein FliQ [Candidatus Gastranaerophilales bacterium]|nr:flagellar biosynthetic protein FliQ [Candidatus Gastranaerophilales bacterium]